MMDARIAARVLGGEATGRHSLLCPAPGHSPRDRSLHVTFTPDGFVVHPFAGDDWQTCKDHVRDLLRLGGFRPAPIGSRDAPDDRDRAERALALWDEARPIEGSPAETYLRSRGLSYQGEALRWHQNCPFGKGTRHGAMIGLVRNIVTNEPQAIHRTALDPGGGKIGRKALGPLRGGCVKLSPDEDVTLSIAIGEGIETTLAIREIRNADGVRELENMRVWACLSASGIAAFPAIYPLETVWIAADRDRSGTGERAAQVAADRLTKAGIEVIIVAPRLAGRDLNDMVA